MYVRKERDEAVSHRADDNEERPRSSKGHRHEEDNMRRSDDRRKYELFRRGNRQEERWVVPSLTHRHADEIAGRTIASFVLIQNGAKTSDGGPSYRRMIKYTLRVRLAATQ